MTVVLGTDRKKDEWINPDTFQPSRPLHVMGAFLFCSHYVCTSAELEGREDWLGKVATPPVAKATDRSEGQQREQSWIPHFGPASASGTKACGTDLYVHPHAALETLVSTRL